MAEGREFEGKNVDQAVFRAAQELGRSPEDLEFEVVDRRPDRVRIRVEAGAAGGAALVSAEIGSQPTRDEAAPVRRRETPPPRPRRHDAPPPRQREAREPFPSRDERASAGSPDEDPEAPWSGEPLYPDLSRMVEALLSAAGVELSVEVQSEPDCERVVVDGPDSALLTDEDGEGLSALEHLLNKMALRGVGRRLRIRVDSGGFRRRREEDIVQMALESAAKVRREGGECSTSPLNPYERRLVHLALKEDPSVVTQSVGNGFLKTITIRSNQRSGGEG